jgi:2-dehydro-3-deoxyphosphogluconate aldolase/(4S)-4-hydroxy-2-oxoglutarate aldolase
VEALVAGGVTGIEITYSTPDAASVVATLSERYADQILLGVGTIVTEQQALDAAEAGAAFLVCPGTTPGVAAAMTGTGVTCLLGALTPSEVMTALAAGADAVKLFPASLGGPGYLSSLRGPFPDVPFVPTGGVDVDNLGQWRRAGVIAVGAGSDLCAARDLAAGRWPELTAKARAFTRAWADAAP